MTYEEAVGFYHSLMRFGINPGLERALMLCEKLGSPQNKLKFIHVGGTNGKGTTCTEISSVLTESGYKTGLYTSPYVIDFRERIQLNNKLISKEDLIYITQQVQSAIFELNSVGVFPTEFEAVTAAAFLYFANQKCDVVVLEVGLGGRFDATNIIENPLCSIIVSVSLDHMAVLGNTIEEIAAEKCGIIKPECTVITSKNQSAEALKVIKKTCEERDCKLIIADEDAIFKINGFSIVGTDVTYKSNEMHIPFSGLHQIENASLCVSACELLNKTGYDISVQNIINGIGIAFIPARTEVLCKKPLVILDGSHNVGSTSALSQVLRQNLYGKRIVAVMGMMKDKDCTAALQNVLPYFSRVIAVTPSNPRAMPAVDFFSLVKKLGTDCISFENPLNGIDEAFNILSSYDALCVCGSLYLASDVRSYLIEKCGFCRT